MNWTCCFETELLVATQYLKLLGVKLFHAFCVQSSIFNCKPSSVWRGVADPCLEVGIQGSRRSLLGSKSVWGPSSYYLLGVQLRGMRYSWYFTLCLCLLEVWPYFPLGSEAIGSPSSSSHWSRVVYMSKGRRRHTAGPQAVLQETPGWLMKA